MTGGLDHTSELAQMIVAGVLAAWLLAVLGASLLVVRRLIPLLRSIRDAVRTSDDEHTVTALGASADLAGTLAAARSEIRSLRTEMRSIGALQERLDEHIDRVDGRVTDLSERVTLVETSARRAHDRIDRITNTGA